MSEPDMFGKRIDELHIVEESYRGRTEGSTGGSQR